MRQASFKMPPKQIIHEETDEESMKIDIQKGRHMTLRHKVKGKRHSIGIGFSGNQLKEEAKSENNDSDEEVLFNGKIIRAT